MNVIVFLCVLVVISTIPDIVLTNSGVIIEKNSNTPYICGRNLTITCKFKKNTTVIVWKDENDIDPIAQCIHDVCRLNPIHVGQYNISVDLTQFIFNLTLIKVTMKDNGRKFVCSDGSHTDSQIIRVKGNEPRLFEDGNFGTITVTSGCISQDKQISFEWIKISASSKVESTINRNIIYKNTSCSTDSECGHEHKIEHTEIINAQPSDNGNYYLKVMVYGNERIELLKSALKYMIEGQDNNSDKNSYIRTKSGKSVDLVIAVVVVVVVVVAIILVILVVLVYCLCKCRKKKLIKGRLTQPGKKESEKTELVPKEKDSFDAVLVELQGKIEKTESERHQPRDNNCNISIDNHPTD